MNINDVKFDENGLVPAIVQDFYTKKVLTLAYMNEESLKISIDEGKTCFFSRSRQKLWRKGETSNNFQHIVTITADCDMDALVIEVIKDGPACHTGADSCFYNEIARLKDKENFSLDTLYQLLRDRKKTMPDGSYTTYLFREGKEKILKKVGEECTEVIIGAMKDSKKETVYEIADLAYHTLVLMVETGISLEDIKNELASRHIVDKKEKQKTIK